MQPGRSNRQSLRLWRQRCWQWRLWPAWFRRGERRGSIRCGRCEPNEKGQRENRSDGVEQHRPYRRQMDTRPQTLVSREGDVSPKMMPHTDCFANSSVSKGSRSLIGSSGRGFCATTLVRMELPPFDVEHVTGLC